MIETWCVYLLECADGTYYCGITCKGVFPRLAQHNSGCGAKYLRGSRIPAKVIAVSRAFPNRSVAQEYEYKVKQKPKHKKIEYVNTL